MKKLFMVILALAILGSVNMYDAIAVSVNQIGDSWFTYSDGFAYITGTGIVFRGDQSAGWAERMYVTPAGNLQLQGSLLIGTTDALDGEKIHAVGTVRLNDSWFPYADNRVYITGKEIVLRGNEASGWAEGMRLTSGGNVGIGTVAPQAKLDVAGDIKANDVLVGGESVATLGDLSNFALQSQIAALQAQIDALKNIINDLPPGLRKIDRDGDGK